MSLRAYLSPIVGSGTAGDPYRPKIADAGVAWVAILASQPDGKPKKSWSLVIVGANDFSALDADTTLAPFPGLSFDTLISSFNAPTRRKAQDELDKRGIAVTVANYTTVGELIEAVGREQNPNFSLASLYVTTAAGG